MNKDIASHTTIRPVGETAFSVEFGDAVDADLNRLVHAYDAALRAHPLPGLVETVPTYRSLLVMYDPLIKEAQAMRSMLLQTLAQIDDAELPEGRLVEIPVRYGGEWGPDLDDVAAHCGLTPDEVVRRHAGALYQVAMLGFAPGFAYLLGLPAQLATPRLPTPRLRVPPGSVGIAGEQTGVYALETPGGWRIIGRTDAILFDAARPDPFLLSAGDRVRFVPDPNCCLGR